MAKNDGLKELAVQLLYAVGVVISLMRGQPGFSERHLIEGARRLKQRMPKDRVLARMILIELLRPKPGRRAKRAKSDPGSS